MKSLGLSNRRVGSVAAVFALLLSTVAPGLLPAFASADQVTDRSITLSSSSKGATNVTYKVEFTAVKTASDFIVDFCPASPLIGDTCGSTDMVVTGAASASSGVTATAGTGHQVRVTKAIAASDQVSVELTGITNPSAAGPIYARIVTFANSTNAGAYTSTAPGTYEDNGGVAMDITDSIGVNAAVLESLTFCVGGPIVDANPNPFAEGCTARTTIPAPTLTLGETVGTVKALSAAAVSTGDVYTQLSTNASSGAIVRIKSANACGGLKRFEATGCDIAPSGNSGTVAANSPKIGLKLTADSTSDATLNATGSFGAATGYDGTNYRLYYNGTTDGVASAYGDPILNTDDTGTPTQPSNKNMKLTFGASVAPNTPAGSYSNSYSLIATGKF